MSQGVSSTSLTQHNASMPEAVEKLIDRLRFFLDAEGAEKAASVELGPEEVLLCCGIKTGSTWLQQIVHALRSRGDMDFEEVSDVIPVVELSCSEGFPTLDVHVPHPRVFKSHLPYETAPKIAGKRIVTTRNPVDAAVSFYYFYGNWLFELDELSLEDFVEWMIIRDRPPDNPFVNAFQMRHLTSWYPHRNDRNTLWLHYEDMIEDLPQCIKMISDFLEIGVGDAELQKLVEDRASIEFMKKHKSKFDLHPAKLKTGVSLSLPVGYGIDNNPGKVRNGKMNEGKKSLSQEMQNKMAEKWRSLIQPVTGHATYEEMRAAINKELGRNFAKT